MDGGSSARKQLSAIKFLEPVKGRIFLRCSMLQLQAL